MIFNCLFSKEKEQEGMELGMSGSEEHMGRVGREKTVIRLYCLKQYYQQQ